MPKYKFVLASQSPRRKELLKLLISQFDLRPSHINEDISIKDPIDFVESLASEKALSISKKSDCQNEVFLGSDTVVVYDKQILGKPKNRKEAFETLSLLSGKSHEVVTGCAIITDQKPYVFSEVTQVKFSELTKNLIDYYLNLNTYQDKAGSYGIQDEAGVFVQQIVGCYYNIVGLPVNRLNRELTHLLGENWKDLF